jgi:hypothetical protein
MLCCAARARQVLIVQHCHVAPTCMSALVSTSQWASHPSQPATSTALIVADALNALSISGTLSTNEFA